MTPGKELYRRGRATLLASWEAYARGSGGAKLVLGDGFSAGVFPHDPERSIYNNAVLDRDLDDAALEGAIDRMESAYRDAGVDRFAAWAHETEHELCAALSERGYELAETTRAMGRTLGDLRLQLGEIDCRRLEWSTYLDFLDADDGPDGLLRGVDPTAFHALGAWLNGELVAAAIAFDHDGDCGIFNMGTREPFRRRGLGTSLLSAHLRDAAERGCSTASLQATPSAEGVYAAIGFRDLGRFREYAPGSAG